MEEKNMMHTMKFDVKAEKPMQPRDILLHVHNALTEKGYNPINQLVGYILSGDPSYITSHDGARSMIRKLQRDEILEELVTFYVTHKD
ncbi:MAG: IreB family regulatory phosphoprotein [Clostridia bacterium]|nr:IreB family regulatory phosphoprotein [Clostridia bacterium]